MSTSRRHRREKRNKTPWIIGGLGALVVAGGLGAWATSGRWLRPSEAELLASANSYLAKHNNEAARLQVKTLLQANPESAPARFVLGKVLHEGGDMAGAEAELRRALELGHPDVAVLPLLASALVGQQKGAMLIQQFGQTELADAHADGEFKTRLAEALAQEGDTASAEAMLAKALVRIPDYPAALLLRARLAASGPNPADAMPQVEALLARQPDSVDAWMLKGELLLSANPDAMAPALAAYQEALKRQPDKVAAHTAVVSLYLAKNDYANANLAWGAMHKVTPLNPQTLYFEAVLAEQRGDLKRAREITQTLVRGAPNNLRVLLLSGLVELKLGGFAQAEAHLGKAVQTFPKSVLARQLLANAQLKSGQPEKVISLLRTLVEDNPPDAEALKLTAQAQLMMGDSKSADLNFAKAAKLKPGDNQLRTAVALSHVARGQDAVGFGELQTIAASDKGTSADMALISASMRKGDTAGALKAIDVLAAKLPNQALPEHLRGSIALQRKDFASARKGYEAALAKDPDYLPSLAALAQLDLLDKQPAAAKGRFEGLLKRKPGNGPALMALAEINQRAGGKPEETAQLLEQAVKAEPAEALQRLMLIDHYINTRQIKPALSAVQAALVVAPDNPELLDRAGRVQLLSGDTQQAVSAFTKLANLTPKAALPQLRLADAHAAANNRTAMAAAVRKAAEIAPNALPVQRALAQLAVLEGKPAQAVAIARTLQTQHPDDAYGFGLEGEIEMGAKNWEAAAAALRKASTRKEPGDALLRLHAALVAGGKTAEADKLVADHRKANPDDLAMTMHLADMALGAGDAAQAEQYYRQVLARQPDSALANNNLAFALAKQKKPGGVALAEKALKYNPGTPALLDTLAFALAVEQQLPRAIEVQSQAVAASPNQPQYRLQLARLQLQAGDKVNARLELARLAKLGAAFPKQDEVAALLKEAGG